MTGSERVGALILEFGLSPSQAIILERLAQSRGRVVSIARLRHALYPQDCDDPISDTVPVFVWQLRQRFGPHIVWAGVGYVLSRAGLHKIDDALQAIEAA